MNLTLMKAPEAHSCAVLCLWQKHTAIVQTGDVGPQDECYFLDTFSLSVAKA
jgi:hypothetical protein